MIADLVIATAVLLLGLLASWQTRALISLQRRLAQESAERASVARDLAALLDCSRALGGRVTDQAARVQALAAQLQTTSRRHEESAPAAFDNAHKLLDEGLDVARVASLCELSQGEAALLSRWRARRAAA